MTKVISLSDFISSLLQVFIFGSSWVPNYPLKVMKKILLSYWNNHGSLRHINFTRLYIIVGFGVVATKHHEKGDFLLEYVGERIDKEEAEKRERRFPENKIFEVFKRNGQKEL